MSPANALKQRQGDSAPGRIISAATSLFAKKGYDATSTKEICELAEVNIAAVHYHFGSKEELFRQIISAFGGARLEIVKRILVPPESPGELKVRLEMFVSESLEVCIQEPELCRIVQTEMELLKERSEKVFKETFVKLFETLVIFIAQAQKKKLLLNSIDPQIASQFLFNQLRQATRAEAVNKKYFNMSIRNEEFRKKWIAQTISIFLSGIIQSSAKERP